MIGRYDPVMNWWLVMSEIQNPPVRCPGSPRNRLWQHAAGADKADGVYARLKKHTQPGACGG